MESNVTRGDYSLVRSESSPPQESQSSGVSWGAVIGGAFVASAVYLILLALGAGFGLSVISPWANVGVSASTAGTAAIVWLIVIEAVASLLGGYLTGRLRTKWTLIHNDEVYFRDTANGLLSWAVALVVSVALLGSAATSMAGRTAASATPSAVADRSAVSRLVPESDQLAPPADSVQAEDAARKATAHLLLWLFVSLLLGAFCASFAATIGGRQRDHVKAA